MNNSAKWANLRKIGQNGLFQQLALFPTAIQWEIGQLAGNMAIPLSARLVPMEMGSKALRSSLALCAELMGLSDKLGI